MGSAADNEAMNRSILSALRRIIRAIDLHSHHLMDEHGLTGPQLAALHEIARGGVVSASEVARAMQLSQPTMTGILERLERRKLITRTRSGTDRRTVDIGITDEGRRLLATAPPLLQERFSTALARLQPWEQTMILATLQRIAAMMDAEDLPATPQLVTGPEQL